jgi:hypothetical protein
VLVDSAIALSITIFATIIYKPSPSRYPHHLGIQGQRHLEKVEEEEQTQGWEI